MIPAPVPATVSTRPESSCPTTPAPWATTAAPWPLQTCLLLAAIPTAPSCARGHVRAVAREWSLPELADTAELLASELVTNAVQASERLSVRADLAVMPVVRLWLVSDRL